MPRIALVWFLLLLLPAWPTRGQETDSLFFGIDSLLAPADRSAIGARAAISQRHETAEPFMRARIHFTGDFIRRLNDITGSETQHRLRIRSLFDNEDPRFVRGQHGETSAYLDAVDQFVDAVCASQPVPSGVDLTAQLYAEVLGRVTWQQQERPIRIYLRKHRTGDAWAWEIIGVGTDFSLPPPVGVTLARVQGGAARRDSLAFIAPNAHELNFMGLVKQLRAGVSLDPYISAAAVDDTHLAAVSHGLVIGQLRWQALLTTTLWLTTQGGWLVQLRQFNRETDNSGWLISNLCPLNEPACLPAVLRCFIAN